MHRRAMVVRVPGRWAVSVDLRCCRVVHSCRVRPRFGPESLTGVVCSPWLGGRGEHEAGSGPRRSTLAFGYSGFVHRLRGTISLVDEELLPVAVLTTDDGVEVVGVMERADGSLVRRDGERLDLVSVVVVLGLEPLAA